MQGSELPMQRGGASRRRGLALSRPTRVLGKRRRACAFGEWWWWCVRRRGRCVARNLRARFPPWPSGARNRWSVTRPSSGSCGSRRSAAPCPSAARGTRQRAPAPPPSGSWRRPRRLRESVPGCGAAVHAASRATRQAGDGGGASPRRHRTSGRRKEATAGGARNRQPPRKKNSISITHSFIGEHHCLQLIYLIFRACMKRLHLPIRLLQGLIPWRLRWRPDQLFHSCTSTHRKLVSIRIQFFLCGRKINMLQFSRRNSVISI